MRWFLLFGMFWVSMPVQSADYTNAAIPLRTNIVRNDGFMIDGGFGNPAECTVSDQLFVRADHPQYRLIYDTVLAAAINNRRIFAYVLRCQDVTWYALPGTTFNVIEPTGSVGLTY